MKCALIGYGYWGKILETYIHKSDFFQLKYIYAPSLKNITLQQRMCISCHTYRNTF